MSIEYEYVGPKDLLDLVSPDNIGYLITCNNDVIRWCEETEQERDALCGLSVTYTIDTGNNWRIGDDES